MSLADIRSLYEYTEWANERMLAAIAGLSDEQYTRPIVSSYSSIRDTLAHIAGAEWIWMQRCRGNNPTAQPEWAAEAPLSRLSENMRAVAAERRAYLDALHEGQLDDPLSYRNLKGEPFTQRLADVLFHVANHSTYHRGQLTTMIRQAGAVPPSTDLIVFHRERRT
jgi:uncharacterized damage-inducible protein DinB